MANRRSPYSTGWPFSTSTATTSPATSHSISFMSFMASTMHRVWPGFTKSPGCTKAAAVALGACVVEKHFTLDRNLPGPDHQASAGPAELVALVRGIRKVEAAMGDGRKSPAAAEADTAAVARKSLVAAMDIPAGTVLTAAMLTAMRPGTGISPAEAGRVVGRRALKAVAKGTVFSWEMLG